ncbi:putative Aminotransferase class V [Trypanosoma vivax]|uniref:cysteine desulfurase n=1 Tax=Trypanosoma vivax (strain Y486) TaxID=1055687 RepID=G0U3F5_TRYVY|nr:putative aminotransferase [Trypanosoma vivax]KAH8613809.1 putative Aminotransferase class V [Trypanosoma vivax]CCC50812.1 putative aminotransferase [Trypanosoma vivax Y486]
MCSIDGPPLKRLLPQPLTPTDPLPIYLDHNATTPLCPEAWEAMQAVVSSTWGNPSSAHPYGMAAKFALEQARAKVAAAIGAGNPETIVFTSGGTESNNMAIIGGMVALRSRCPDRCNIITTCAEHPAVEEVISYLEKESHGDHRGDHFARVVAHRFPVSPKTGCVSVDEWRKLLLALPGGPRSVGMVSVMHANNEIGAVNPVREIVKVVKELCGHEALFHTDAAQSVGKVPVDVDAMQVDMLSLCSHKFYGPKGVGALYVKKDVQLQNILFGAGHEGGLRPGTENVLLVTGMAEALRVACSQIDVHASQMRATRDELLRVMKEELQKANMSFVINGDINCALPNTLSIALYRSDGNGRRKYISAHAVIQVVGNKVCMSSGAACHAGEEHVDVSASLRSVGVESDRALGTLRLTTGRSTTIAEARRAARIIVRQAAQQLGEV